VCGSAGPWTRPTQNITNGCTATEGAGASPEVQAPGTERMEILQGGCHRRMPGEVLSSTLCDGRPPGQASRRVSDHYADSDHSVDRGLREWPVREIPGTPGSSPPEHSAQLLMNEPTTTTSNTTIGTLWWERVKARMNFIRDMRAQSSLKWEITYPLLEECVLFIRDEDRLREHKKNLFSTT
jgi:hypothetical protein